MTSINHVLETSIPITDALLFIRDKDVHINNYLNTEYVGKCAPCGYITQINKILRVSKCVYNNLTNDANAAVNVQFEVSCINFGNGDILTNVLISKNLNGLLMGHYNKIANVCISSKITIKGRQYQLVFNENTIVCITVDKCNLTPKSRATIVGKILIPDTSFETYYIAKDLSESDWVEINRLIEMIEIEYGIREKTKNMLALEHFYYSIKSETDAAEIDGWYGPNFNTKKYLNIISHLKAKKSVVGTWCRPLDIVRSSPFVDYSSETMPFSTPAKVAIVKMLLQINTWARIMNEQHLVFDQKLFESNKQLWTLFSEIKSSS